MFMELQQQRMSKRKYPNSHVDDCFLIPCESIQTARNELHSISRAQESGSDHLVTANARQKHEAIRRQNAWEESLETVRREDLWFKTVSRGTAVDLEKMSELLADDPNGFFFDGDPRKLINAGKMQT